MNDLMTIAGRIKEVRANKTQQAFAAPMKAHLNTIGRWERGERVPDHRDLLKILESNPDISPAWLLAGEGPMYRLHRADSGAEKAIDWILLQLCELKQMTLAFSEAVRQGDESGKPKLDNYRLYGVLLQKIEEITTAVDSVQKNVSGEQNASRNEGGHS